MAIWLWVPAGAAALAFGPSPSRTASPGTPSRSGSADATTKTRAIFYTESDYNPSVSGWVGRLSVLRAATPESPRWVADATNPTGLAVDSLRGRVYWTDPGDASIHTCLADGTDHSLVAAGTFGHRMNDGPFGIAVDEQAEVSVWGRRCGATRPRDGSGKACATRPRQAPPASAHPSPPSPTPSPLPELNLERGGSRHAAAVRPAGQRDCRPPRRAERVDRLRAVGHRHPAPPVRPGPSRQPSAAHSPI